MSFSELSQKINTFLSNIEFKSSEKCQLEYDNANSFARPIWVLGNMYTPDYSLGQGGPSLIKRNPKTEFRESSSKDRDYRDTFDYSNSQTNNLSFFKNASGMTFLNDFYSKLWFSYRKSFAPIKFYVQEPLSGRMVIASENSQLSSDVGWGCVIRCTQMLLAQALVVKLLGRSWRKLETLQPNTKSSKTSGFNRHNESPTEKQQSAIYSNILSWFSDTPGNSFSIHTLCELIVEELKCDNWQPGNWLGPATAANIIQQSVEIAKLGMLSLQLSDLHVYVARDSLIDPAEVYPEESNFRKEDAVIILVPLRLGTTEFNIEYKNSILKLFCFDNFLGIIGGKPRKSFYFIGAQGDELIYLDPHFVQESDANLLGKLVNESTYHCQNPRTLNISKIDPTMTLGFIFKNSDEFYDFMKFCQASRVFYRTTDVANGYGIGAHDNPACPMVSFGCRKDLDRSDLIIDFDDLKLVGCNDNSESSNDRPKEPFVFL